MSIPQNSQSSQNSSQNRFTRVKDTAGRFFGRLLVSLGEQYSVQEVVDKIVGFLDNVSGSDLYSYYSNNMSLLMVDDSIKGEWVETISGVALSSKRFGYSDSALKVIDSITPQLVIAKVLEAAVKQSRENCQRNISLIVNTPGMLKWFIWNVEQAKQFIRDVFTKTLEKVV
ncbi:MAG: hypothetical protein QXO47_10095 [Thermoproteota archaeon]